MLAMETVRVAQHTRAPSSIKDLVHSRSDSQYHRLPTPDTSGTSNTSPASQSPSDVPQSLPFSRDASRGAYRMSIDFPKYHPDKLSFEMRERQFHREPNSPPYNTNDQFKPSLPPLKAILGHNIVSPPTTPTTEDAPSQPYPQEPRFMSSTYMPPSLYPNKKPRTDLFLYTQAQSDTQIRHGELAPRPEAFASFDRSARSARRTSVSHRNPYSRPMSRLQSPRSSTYGAQERRLHDLAYYADNARQHTAHQPSAVQGPPSSYPGHVSGHISYADADNEGRSAQAPWRPTERRSSDCFSSQHFSGHSTSDSWSAPRVSGSYHHRTPSVPMRPQVKQAGSQPLSPNGQSPFFLPSHYDPQNGKARRRSNLPKQSTEIMKTWFDQNIHNPYPSEEQKAYFSNATGISMTQVSNWFINHRRRCPELRDRRDRTRQGDGDMDMAS